MDIQKRIEEFTAQQQALIQRQQEDGINIQRLAGAIAILNEQLNSSSGSSSWNCRLSEDDAALPTEESEEE